MLQPEQPGLRQGEGGRGSRVLKENKPLSNITPQEANSVFKDVSALKNTELLVPCSAHCSTCLVGETCL